MEIPSALPPGATSMERVLNVRLVICPTSIHSSVPALTVIFLVVTFAKLLEDVLLVRQDSLLIPETQTAYLARSTTAYSVKTLISVLHVRLDIPTSTTFAFSVMFLNVQAVWSRLTLARSVLPHTLQLVEFVSHALSMSVTSVHGRTSARTA